MLKCIGLWLLILSLLLPIFAANPAYGMMDNKLKTQLMFNDIYTCFNPEVALKYPKRFGWLVGSVGYSSQCGWKGFIHIYVSW